ncbi:cell division protein FtsZ [Parasphingorhabdus sp. JC815]|uniref:cell division protein FtsZ n=1 Tax=Parasphingorhabdus sp. JC815 TaxID=3232140 RepID=UPI00345755E4
MSINIGPPEVEELKPRIAVIGVGGAGGNAIANMIAAKVEGVDFIVSNTDAQALNSSPAEQRIQLGPEITQGLGAGSRPEVGRAAAEETLESVEQALEGAHMCFIAAGMGGGTGTGAAPVIAKAARDKGILTVGVVTKPFTFEGTRRMKSANAGIEELQKNVDTLIIIPNQNLFLVANPNTTFKEAFLLADEVLQQGVRGITDLMVMPGLINLDFADVRSVMHEMGKAMMGTGEAEGDGRALEAAEKAIANPLLDGVSMQGAKGVIVSITGGEDMRLMEVDEAANHIRELVDPDANIIWGSAFNENLDGRIRVSVVATGIDSEGSVPAPVASPSFATSSPAPSTASFASAIPSESEDQEEELVLDASSSNISQPDQSEKSGMVVEPEVSDSQAPEPAPEPKTDFEPKPQAAPAPSPAATYSDDDLDDGMAAAPSFASLAPGMSSDEPEEDELILGGESIQPEPENKPAKSEPAPRVVSGGGTLFERMSNLTRGTKSEDEGQNDEDGSRDPLDIPRFLNRQNNQ